MATHKSYRARAAESFSSGVESPLEALGTRALREAQAELQRKAAEMEMDSDRDPAALEMLEEALAHEPRDAHERRAAARAYLGVTATRTKSATRVETKGAMPIVAFDAANEEGLDDLEADVNELAYRHNASGMDADTSGGHCEVYFEAAIDAANFVEALQAGDLIGYTVSGVELVPTDGGEDAGEEGKSLSGVETKGTGYEEFRGCVGWLSSAIKGAEDMGADLGDAYDWVGEMFERTKYLPVSFTQDDIDTWSSQLDQIRSLLEGALSEVEDEDETAKGKLPAQKRSLTEGLRQVDRAIEAIDDLEPDSEDEGD